MNIAKKSILILGFAIALSLQLASVNAGIWDKVKKEANKANPSKLVDQGKKEAGKVVGQGKEEVGRVVGQGKEEVGRVVGQGKEEAGKMVGQGKKEVGSIVADVKGDLEKIRAQLTEVAETAKDQIGDIVSGVDPGGITALIGKLLGFAVLACLATFALMLPFIVLRTMFRLAFGRRSSRA